MVSVDYDVLSEILVGIEAMLMWHGWLVDGPVVEWWVDDWVLELSELNLLGVLLVDVDLIWADSHVHVEISLSHGILHEGWVDMNWDTVLILLSQYLVGAHLSGLLLWKGNLIRSDEDLHVEVGITHSVLGNDWVDEDWDTLSQVLACDQILH